MFFRGMGLSSTVIWNTTKGSGLLVSVVDGGACIMKMAQLMKENGMMIIAVGPA